MENDGLDAILEAHVESEVASAKAYAESKDWFDALNHLIMGAKYATKRYGFSFPDDVDELFSRAVGFIGSRILDASTKDGVVE